MELLLTCSPWYDELSVEDPMTIFIPCSSKYLNLSTFSGTASTATVSNFDLWTRNSLLTALPRNPLAPMSKTDGPDIVSIFNAFDIRCRCFLFRRTLDYNISKPCPRNLYRVHGSQSCTVTLNFIYSRLTSSPEVKKQEIPSSRLSVYA